MDPGNLGAAGAVAGLVVWRVEIQLEDFLLGVGSAFAVVGEVGRRGGHGCVGIVGCVGSVLVVVEEEEERIGGRGAEGSRIFRVTLIPSLMGCAIENRSGPVCAAESDCGSGTGSSGCRRWRGCRCIVVSGGCRSGCDCDCDCRSWSGCFSFSSLGRIPATIRSMCSLRRCPPWTRPGSRSGLARRCLRLGRPWAPACLRRICVRHR